MKVGRASVQLAGPAYAALTQKRWEEEERIVRQHLDQVREAKRRMMMRGAYPFPIFPEDLEVVGLPAQFADQSIASRLYHAFRSANGSGFTDYRALEKFQLNELEKQKNHKNSEIIFVHLNLQDEPTLPSTAGEVSPALAEGGPEAVIQKMRSSDCSDAAKSDNAEPKRNEEEQGALQFFLDTDD